MKVIAAAFILTVLVSAVAGTLFVEVAKTNSGPSTPIPPIVSVPEIRVNAVISRVNGTLWAKVDAAYQMNTTYALGDTYQTQNYGFGLVVDPSNVVTVTVAYDKLQAHYPVPLNSTNISVRMDDAELNLVLDKRFYHLFDANLPELNWTISPVPHDFIVTVHYEHPVYTTGEDHAHLGRYAFLFPLGARYGLEEIGYMYNEYPWFGNSTLQFTIQIEPIFTNIHPYSIDGFGTLTPLNYTVSTENAAERIELIVAGAGETPPSYETTSPYGVVVVFDETTETSEPFPTTLVIASGTTVAVVGVGLLIYFRKHNQ